MMPEEMSNFTERELNDLGRNANWRVFRERDIYEFVTNMTAQDKKDLRERAILQEYFDLKTEISDLELERDNLSEKIDLGIGYKSDINETGDFFELIIRNSEIREKNAEIQTKSVQIGSLEYKLNELESERISFERKISEIEEQMDSVRKEYLTSDNPESANLESLSSYNEKIEELKIFIENNIRQWNEISKIQSELKNDKEKLENERTTLEKKIEEIKIRQEKGYIDFDKKNKDIKRLEEVKLQIIEKSTRVEELFKIILEMGTKNKRRSSGPRKSKIASNDIPVSLDDNLSAETVTPTNSAGEPLKIENPVMPEDSNPIDMQKGPEEPIKEDQIETGPADDNPDKNGSELPRLDDPESIRVDAPDKGNPNKGSTVETTPDDEIKVNITLDDKGKESKKLNKVRKVNFAWARGFAKFVKEKVKKRLDNLSYAPKMDFSSINRQEGYENTPPPLWVPTKENKERLKQIKSIKRSESWWAKGFRDKIKPKLSKWWKSLRDGYEIPVDEQKESIDPLFRVDSDEINDDGIRVSLA